MFVFVSYFPGLFCLFHDTNLQCASCMFFSTIARWCFLCLSVCSCLCLSFQNLFSCYLFILMFSRSLSRVLQKIGMCFCVVCLVDCVTELDCWLFLQCFLLFIGCFWFAFFCHGFVVVVVFTFFFICFCYIATILAPSLEQHHVFSPRMHYSYNENERKKKFL